MKKEKHYLKMRDGKFLLVTGYVFYHKGHAFFIHREVTCRTKNGGFDPGGKAGYYSQDKDNTFRVTELQTGTVAYRGGRNMSREDVLIDFQDYIKRQEKSNKKSITQIIQEAITQTGKTPEFDRTRSHLILDTLLEYVFTWKCIVCDKSTGGSKDRPKKLCFHNNEIKMKRLGHQHAKGRSLKLCE